MIHIMLDLETWGTAPGCDIRSIGACVFDPVVGMIAGHNEPTVAPPSGLPTGTFYIACDNPNGYWMEGEFRHTEASKRRKYLDLHRDPRTVQWWSEQSDEAQAAFADPVDLRAALERFRAWIEQVAWQPHLCFSGEPMKQGEWREPPEASDCIRLWSHGAHFDPPILAAAYQAVGLPVPWHYRAPRDTRTAFDMAGIDDHKAWLEQHPGPLGIAHHALDDAICQARAVCGAWARVTAWRCDYDMLGDGR